MNLEQLQNMSDAELNELSAVKVMGKLYQIGKMWEKVEGGAGHRLIADWNPTTDMNDAMELMDKTKIDHDHIGLYCSQLIGTTWTVTITDIHPPAEDGFPDVKEMAVEADTAPRAITIASILAKEE